MRIYDDHYHRWITGQIINLQSPSLRLRIDYNGIQYLMENQYQSEIIQIRNEKRREILLTRFYPRFRYPFSSSFSLKNNYQLEIYSNDLPDQIYILALALFNDRKTKEVFVQK